MSSREYDGYLTLFFSVILIALSFGLTFLLVFIYIFYIAVYTCSDDIESDQIIVLGKKLNNNQPGKDYRLRLNRAVTIITLRTNPHIYILGGITDDSMTSESRSGRSYLEDRNIQTRLIHIEEMSRDTLDNMKQLKISGRLTEKNIALITNRYHLARASLMAQGFGFNVQRCAAESSFRLDIVAMLALFTESFFLHWYLSGRLYAKLTRNQRILERLQ